MFMSALHLTIRPAQKLFLFETEVGSLVDCDVAVYPAGAVWDQRPVPPLYEDGPVVRVIEPMRNALARALAER